MINNIGAAAANGGTTSKQQKEPFVMTVTSIENDVDDLRHEFGELNRATRAVRTRLWHLCVRDADHQELIRQIDHILDLNAQLHVDARAALRCIED